MKGNPDAEIAFKMAIFLMWFLIIVAGIAFATLIMG